MPTKAINQYILGTAIKFTVSLNIPTATSVTISIQNSSDTYKITNAIMTKDADYIYSYVWQSVSTDEDGRYRVTIKAVSGSNTSIKIVFFDAIDADDFGEIEPRFQ